MSRNAQYVNTSQGDQGAITDDRFTLSQASKIKEAVAAIQSNQSDQEPRTIVEWLSPLDFVATQSDIFQRRTEGTGEWLLEHADFKEWRDQKSGKVWCSGIPGAGKTVLASVIVNRLRTTFDRRVAIACIYCNYKEQTTQTASNLVAALLKQIVQDQYAISDSVKSLYLRHINRRTRPTFDEFAQTLQLELETYSRVFIVIDALDECSEYGVRERLLRSLPSPVNLLVTSRDLPEIAWLFPKAKRLDIRANDQDVQKYIESRIHGGRLARLVRGDLDLQKSIVEKIVRNADGMFLLAPLYVDSLVRKVNLRAVRKALETLPREVNVIYDDVMRRIAAQDRDEMELAKRALSWVAYAYRPLSLMELQHALAVELGATNVDPDAIVDSDILTSVCCGLITFQADTDTSEVRFVHHTAQQYFEHIRESSFSDAPAHIAATCLTYLSFDVFQKSYSKHDLEPLLDEYPLLDYATRYWNHHVRGDAQPPNGFPEVHLTSNSGDLKDMYGSTPLSCAAANGHKDVVKLLLARDDVNVNSQDKRGQTPLSCAAENGHEAIVTLLLSQDGIDVNLSDEYDMTPLSWAARMGHRAVAALLLARDDVEADSKDINGMTPLWWATSMGNKAVMLLLLALDEVDMNSRDKHGQTLLLWGAENGREAEVAMLLVRGDVAVDCSDKYGRTPLSWAARMGHAGVVKLLLKRNGVNIDSKDIRGRTPLSWAAENGHEGVVTLLLTRIDVSVNSDDAHGRTPLSWAARMGHEGVVKLLLTRNDTEVDSKDIRGRTPLSWAAENGHEKVVTLLLTRIDVAANSNDAYGRTPLSLATRMGHKRVVMLLLVQDDHMNSK